MIVFGGRLQYRGVFRVFCIWDSAWLGELMWKTSCMAEMSWSVVQIPIPPVHGSGGGAETLSLAMRNLLFFCVWHWVFFKSQLTLQNWVYCGKIQRCDSQVAHSLTLGNCSEWSRRLVVGKAGRGVGPGGRLENFPAFHGVQPRFVWPYQQPSRDLREWVSLPDYG